MDQPLDPFFVKQVRDGHCVLFAGAGLSAAAGFPNWVSLVRNLAKAERPPGVEPKSAALEALIARGKLLEAAEWLREELGPDRFHQALRDELARVPKTLSPTHRLLPQFRFRAIITTNFDQLIETAFENRLPVATQRDAGDVARHLGANTPFLYKIHGDIERPETIVLTSDDFAEIILRNDALRTVLQALFLTNPMLFVGYSHADPDFDLVVREHVNQFGHEGARRYALMKVGGDEDLILTHGLQKKSIQVVPFQDYGDVPRFFETLLEATRSGAEQITSEPPAAGPQALKPSTGLRRRLAREPRRAGERVAVILPGLFGSQLSARAGLSREVRIWLNMWRLALGGIARLDLSPLRREPARIRADDVLANYYGELALTLAQNREVRLFAYDWRQDYWQLADELRTFLRRQVDEGVSCDLVAHAEGGLVARAYIAENPEEWAQLRGERDSRLVMLGTPNHGSFQHLMVLLGENSLVRTLAKLDLKHSVEEVRRVFASFPSLYQSMPSPLRNAAWSALYQRASWGAVEVDPELLEAGLQFHNEIAGAVDPERMICVLGDGHPTIVSLGDPTRLDGAPQWAMSNQGDGTVAEIDARLEKEGREIPTYFCPDDHSGLTSSPAVLAALADLLDRGQTDRLPREPASRSDARTAVPPR